MAELKIESAQERMFQNLMYETSEKARAILGMKDRAEICLSVYNAPSGEIEYMQDINKELGGEKGKSVNLNTMAGRVSISSESMPF